MKNYLKTLASALALGLPLWVAAQVPASGRADPKTPAPELRYESAFADYRPYQDARPGDWRAINAAVGKPPVGHAMGLSAPRTPPSIGLGHGGHPMGGDKK
ncbi:hypothetical protein WKW80_34050 [Variovorax humicola]|uniref:Uncharacterized protein n=1 Tax=Variovorax humicola TaxID=1769758 RepID=A0ABU8WAA8_9BURK